MSPISDSYRVRTEFGGGGDDTLVLMHRCGVVADLGTDISVTDILLRLSGHQVEGCGDDLATAG
jgi:hypothetical protein